MQKVGVAYGSGQMCLIVDGVASADVSYTGTLLTGALDLFRSASGTGLMRQLQRYDAPFSQIKTQLISLTQ